MSITICDTHLARTVRYLSLTFEPVYYDFAPFSYDKSDRNNPNTLYKRHVDCQFDRMDINLL